MKVIIKNISISDQWWYTQWCVRLLGLLCEQAYMSSVVFTHALGNLLIVFAIPCHSDWQSKMSAS